MLHCIIACLLSLCSHHAQQYAWAIPIVPRRSPDMDIDPNQNAEPGEPPGPAGLTGP